MKPTFFAKSNGKRGEIYIYEEIGAGWYGGITAKSFAETMKDLGKVSALDIYINSPGGSVFDGISIYNQIKRFDGEKATHVDGIAASISSVIAMAGDPGKRFIADNGMLMIHDPWSIAFGTAADMRKMADSLDKVRETILDTYVRATDGDHATISDMMAAETWLSADEAVEKGFASAKTEELAVKAEFAMLAKFQNTPAQVRKAASTTNALLARMDKRTMQLRRVSPATA